MYYYNAVKEPYLAKIHLENLKNFKGVLPIEDIEKFIRNKEENLSKKKEIIFPGINERLSISLLELCDKYNVSERVIFFICLIENNFGLNITSNADARGPMQIKPETVIHMENKYRNLFSLEGDYENLSGSEKTWREIQCGVLYALHITELLELKSLTYNSKSLNLEEFLLTIMCYKEGINKILENLNFDYDLDALKYASWGHASLGYIFIYNNNHIIAKR